MKRDELLERLAAIELARTQHEQSAGQLLMERDRLIYEALNTKPKPIVGATEIADVLHVDRSWPYRIRDEYPERFRRWQERQQA